ncbi:hypothetical protein GCM10010207_77520 [Streptomyces atratus]|nr:hypothetical protein GCM10010207_77520 [Streptomyces atratus]
MAVLEPYGGIGVGGARLPGDRPGPAALALDAEDQVFRAAVGSYLVDRFDPVVAAEDGRTLRGEAVEGGRCPRDGTGYVGNRLLHAGCRLPVAGYQFVRKRSRAWPGFVMPWPDTTSPNRAGLV